MAVTRHVDARTVGQTFAEMTERDPDAHGIYVRPSGDSIDVWMLASHSDYDSGDAVFEMTVTIQRRFPDTPIRTLFTYSIDIRYAPQFQIRRADPRRMIGRDLARIARTVERELGESEPNQA